MFKQAYLALGLFAAVGNSAAGSRGERRRLYD